MSHRRSNRRLRAAAAFGGSFVGALMAASLALAGFSSTATATHTVATKRIFPGSRTTGPRKISDTSSGVEVTSNDALSFADAVVTTTGNWTTAFASTRYLQYSMNSPLPAGVPVSSANFNFRMRPSTSTDSACYYFEVRRQSDNSLLGTHFSSSSPRCVTGATFTTISTPLSEVTTSDIANDVYVKVFGRNSGSGPMQVDLATLTLSEFSTAETLFEEAYVDASTGTAAQTTWWTDAADAAQFTTVSAWPTAFSTLLYLQFTFPSHLPSAAVVTGAIFTHSYKSATAGDTVCHYFEVYSNTTLLAAHGSSATPFSCNSTTSFRSEAVSLPEVNTAAKANTVVIKDYVKDTTLAGKTIHDVDTLTVTYYLN
jgi:hypothetical protein